MHLDRAKQALMYNAYLVVFFSLICFGSRQGVLIGRVHFDCLVSFE